MQLLAVTVRGYRRFASPARMILDGRVIAVVGPNEAGKSSFLDALAHLSNVDPIGDGELSRGAARNGGAVVEAEFALEDEDISTLSDSPECRGVRRLIVSKYADGRFTFGARPQPVRDQRPRQRASDQLARALTHPSLTGQTRGDDGGFSLEHLRDLLASLSVDDESLHSDTIESIRQAASSVATLDLSKAPKYVHELPAVLTSLAKHEADTEPHQQAINTLHARVPRILKFGDDDRTLLRDYELAGDASQTSGGLRNLANLAGLNIAELVRAINESDQARVETLIARANDRLKGVFEQAWGQSSVLVHFRANGTVLHIQIEDPDRSFTDIGERSDGLRQFVALLAFAALERASRPILLVDEAENHLHYDAQADLVAMFERQRVAAKIIYTTHSAGCLPEDLGVGVRLVTPLDGKPRSEIRNWFWEENIPGFSPLLFGMGATTLAFVPMRRAVVAEGPSDFILLPTMFRAVTGRGHLGFQIVPGLAGVSESGVPLLERSGIGVVFLLDADDGGAENRKKLLRAQIDEHRVFQLPSTTEQQLVLEDFLAPDLYVDAVNEELKRSSISPRVTSALLGNNRRPARLRDWCVNQQCREPGRRAVAYRILELLAKQPDRQVVVRSKHQQLRQLYERIAKQLQIPLSDDT